MKKRKLLSLILASAMTLCSALTGCGQSPEDSGNVPDNGNAAITSDVGQNTDPGTDISTPPEGDYIKLALHVLYNDTDCAYYSAEVGDPIYVTEEGQYTLSFDVNKNLSLDAKNAGIHSIENLTAIYIYDLGATEGMQSPLKACNITYDAVTVDDTALTVSKPGPKSAFKSAGIFDTNDPINSWDGSCVDEVELVGEHVVSFTKGAAQKVSVTFTLSDFDWTGADSDASDVSANSSAKDYKNTAVFSDMDFTDMTALELSKYLGNGINLGNTMEATCASKNLPVSSYEMGWGQPVTTPEMIQGMKDCGFDTLRIPVAWTSTMDYENGDFEINEDFMNRVDEIVNYALDSEMFVVLNDHWDYGWWSMFGSSDPDTVELAWKIYTEMWTQIADHFKDYSDMLILESANEELGNSLNDNSSCATSGSLSEDDKYSMTAAINQKFVDIVRSSGGNNDDRFLLIAGYNTDFTLTCDDRYKMPEDTADSKLFLSVHYYTPWNYCGAGEGGKESRWGIKKEYDDMDYYMEMMTKYTDQGYGIIIGEYGALPVYNAGMNTMQPNTEEYTKYFLGWCDIYNYVPLLWTTNSTYRKDTCTMLEPCLTELYTSRCYVEETAKGDAYLDDVRAEMAALKDAAPEVWEGVTTYEAGTPVAWIMWNGGAGTYSVGDQYNPSDCTAGITAHDVVVDGAGEYTVSLDFAGGNDGLTFAALAIASGEDLYPGAIIDITEIALDGEPIDMIALPYTSSDDGHTMRVNLLNEWVGSVPDDARNKMNYLGAASPVILDKTQLTGFNTISITFNLIVNE